MIKKNICLSYFGQQTSIANCSKIYCFMFKIRQTYAQKEHMFVVVLNMKETCFEQKRIETTYGTVLRQIGKFIHMQMDTVVHIYTCAYTRSYTYATYRHAPRDERSARRDFLASRRGQTVEQSTPNHKVGDKGRRPRTRLNHSKNF